MSDRILKISRLVGLDLSYLLTNGFWVALRYGAIAFFGLLLTIGFARLGTKELFGQYQFTLSVVALLSVLSLPGFNVAVLKSVALGEGCAAVQKTVRWSFVSSLLATPIIGGYAAYKYFVRDDIPLEMAVALLAGAILFPFFYAPNTWYAAYEGKSLFKPVVIRAMVSSLSVTVALFTGLLLQVGLVTLVTIYFGLNAIFSWYFYFEIVRREKMRNQEEGSDGRLDIRYGFSVTIQKFVFGLSESMPPIFLSFFLGFEFLAIFQIAYYFMNALSGALAALSAIYLPKLFNGTKLMHMKIVGQNFVVGIVSFLFLTLLLKIIFIPLYGESYRESYSLAWLLAPVLAFYPLRIYLVNYFTAKGRNGLVILVCVIANLLGPGIFLLMKNTDPLMASASYIYTVATVTILVLLPVYFFIASRKMDSI